MATKKKLSSYIKGFADYEKNFSFVADVFHKAQVFAAKKFIKSNQQEVLATKTDKSKSKSKK